MPFTSRAGVRLHWEFDGIPDGIRLVLLNSIGTDIGLWDATMPELRQTFRTLRIDTRGHGASDAPDGDYDLAGLAKDVAAIMDDAQFEDAIVAGVSLGGMIAMQLALDDPGRVSALGLICTAAAMDRDSWSQRVDTVRARGTDAIAEMAVGRFLSPKFAAENPEVAKRIRDAIRAQPDAGYAGAGAAIRDMELLDRLGEIIAPTLVVVGRRDISTPFEGHGDLLARRIPEARTVHLDSAHLPPLEAPVALALTIIEFTQEIRKSE